MRSIKDLLTNAAAAGAFPGAVYLIGNREKILEEGAVGVLGQGLGPVKPDTLYDMASLTKIFVTLALMRQFEEGLVDLEDTIARFLPSWGDTPKGNISLVELLTHTSPIPALSEYWRYCKTREELLEAIRLAPVRVDGSVRVEYTCEGFITLGEIIAAIDGESLDKVVKWRVLDPLGMKETGYKPPPELLDRIAPTENCSWRGRLVRGEVHDENAAVLGGVSGNAGIFSTATDFSRLARAMLSPPGEEFLHKPTIALMTRNYTAGKGDNRGLGWQLKRSYLQRPESLTSPGMAMGDLVSDGTFGHTGFTGTNLWIDPERSLYGILLSNRVHPTRNNPGLFRVRRIFYNLMTLRYGEG